MARKSCLYRQGVCAALVKSIAGSAAAAIIVAVIPALAWSAPLRQVCFKDVCVLAEVADSAPARQVGLMFRSSLAPDAGMLFVFERSGIHAFWMKNTLIPLDMLWLDRDLIVVDIQTRVPVCTSEDCPVVTPRHEALFVLEVNAGFIEAHGIAIGDKARFADE